MLLCLSGVPINERPKRHELGLVLFPHSLEPVLPLCMQCVLAWAGSTALAYALVAARRQPVRRNPRHSSICRSPVGRHVSPN